MTRPLSYKTPSRLAIEATAASRHDDTDRGTLWSQQEIDFLLIHYGRFPVKFIAENLRRSEMSVRIKAHRIRYGIKSGHVSLVKRFPLAAEAGAPQSSEAAA